MNPPGSLFPNYFAMLSATFYAISGVAPAAIAADLASSIILSYIAAIFSY